MKLDDAKFRLQTGIRKEDFDFLLSILKPKYAEAHKNGSNKGIGVECRLVLALSYWREYRSMRHIGFDYDLSASTVCASIHWVEDNLSNDKAFVFGNIEEEIEKLKKENHIVKSVIGDVEEQPIERPIKNQEEHYSGKKKRHTTKNQFIIDEETGKIINIYNETATNHDFKILKDSNVIDVLNRLGISSKFDCGYQGVQKLLNNAQIPFKKSKNNPLTDEQKKYNHDLSSKRIKIEHVNREIKKFRIMKETYRNHQRDYLKRLTIICTLYNMRIS